MVTVRAILQILNLQIQSSTIARKKSSIFLRPFDARCLPEASWFLFFSFTIQYVLLYTELVPSLHSRAEQNFQTFAHHLV
jgi:hypothetical protein